MEKFEYKRPSPGEIAKRIWCSYTSIIHTDAGIEELRWEQLSDTERNSFVEAVEIVMGEELDKISDGCNDVLTELLEERDQRQSERIVDAEYADATHEAEVERACYVCGMYPAYGKELVCRNCKT